jgi:hypothetical protein
LTANYLNMLNAFAHWMKNANLINKKMGNSVNFPSGGAGGNQIELLIRAIDISPFY